MMDPSSSDSVLNPGDVDYEFESNEVPEPLSVVDDELVPKVRMTFTTLEDAGKFYRNYAKAAGFSTRVRCTNRKGNEIKNQLITCSREEKWKSKISPTEKTNPTAGLNCPARIYIHTLKDVGAWIISKVVLDHSHPCCPSKAEMLKQHRELSMSIRRTIENNDEADLYEDRHIWVPIYLDHHFWAGMRSTQRSESMHSFFNKYITRNSSLIQFVKQYDNCLGSREQAERESDAADFHTVIPCATKSSIEAQFQDAYTHAKFREVQAQFRGKANCITRLKNSALGYSVYEVGEQVSSSIFDKFAVTYDSVAAEVKCQCILFESRGILCRHALSVLSFEQVSQVSPRYILERWSKKVKRRHTHIKSSHDEPLMEPRSKRFDQLVFRSQNICEFASESEELTAILHRAYDNVMAEMEALKVKRKGTSSLSHEDANLESVNELQSPPRIRTRGRPKNRLGSKLEKQIANSTKKKKTKVLSEINLFDAASVVHSSCSQYQGQVINYQFRVPAAGDNSLGV
ncbi:Protein FAR-RED ELONGATED HYPOCOTYL [Arachis hypogaea]|nr:Protein FAR-RED ELONGATED HYPOCOTYL [Arachis hypogaea]